MANRFKQSFYTELVKYANRNKITVKEACTKVNDKIKELAMMASPDGSLQVLIIEEFR